MKKKIPLSELNQANAEWLTHTLTANGHLRHGRVARVIRDIWMQSNYSIIARLQVGYSNDAAGEGDTAPPAALLLKFNRPGHTVRSIPSFEPREFEFYSNVITAMVNPPTARCYDAAYDPQSGGSHFLLENLSATHSCAGKALPPTLHDCERMVECLARFHAAWWNDARLGTRIGGPFLDERRSRHAATVTMQSGKFVARLGDRISGPRRAVLQDLCNAYPRLLDRQRTGPLTITHGDAHAQNFLIAKGRTDCRIIDWETWEIAPATDDLAFMMAIHWFAERRQRMERDLLIHYHRALLAAGVSNYSWDAFWGDYRLSVIKHLCTPVYQWVYGVQPAIWWGNLERILTAYEDLGCAEIMSRIAGSHGV